MTDNGRSGNSLTTAFIAVAILAFAVSFLWPRDRYGPIVMEAQLPTLHEAFSRLSAAQELYLENNKVGRPPSEQITTELLTSASELVLIVRQTERDGGNVDDEVIHKLEMVPLSVGCRQLNEVDNDRLLRVNIYLQQDHRPMCEYRSDNSLGSSRFPPPARRALTL